jgi:hypothetical protein
MTDEQIMIEKRKLGIGIKEQTKLNFLQKYYHKGAYYADEMEKIEKDSTKAHDWTAPVGDDKFVDRSMLPKVKYFIYFHYYYFFLFLFLFKFIFITTFFFLFFLYSSTTVDRSMLPKVYFHSLLLLSSSCSFCILLLLLLIVQCYQR